MRIGTFFNFFDFVFNFAENLDGINDHAQVKIYGEAHEPNASALQGAEAHGPEGMA